MVRLGLSRELVGQNSVSFFNEGCGVILRALFLLGLRLVQGGEEGLCAHCDTL